MSNAWIEAQLDELEARQTAQDERSQAEATKEGYRRGHRDGSYQMRHIGDVVNHPAFRLHLDEALHHLAKSYAEDITRLVSDAHREGLTRMKTETSYDQPSMSYRCDVSIPARRFAFAVAELDLHRLRDLPSTVPGNKLPPLA